MWFSRQLAETLPTPVPVPDPVAETHAAMKAANVEFGAAVEARRQFKNEHGIEIDRRGCITHILRIDSQKRGEWVHREWFRLSDNVGRTAAKFHAKTNAWSEAVMAAKGVAA